MFDSPLSWPLRLWGALLAVAAIAAGFLGGSTKRERQRMDDRNPPRRARDDASMLYVPLRPGNHELVDSQNEELFTLADLRRAHRLFGDEEEMKAYLDSLEGKRLHGPGMVWSEGSLIMVAHVSAELRERIRRHLGLSQDEMTARMRQLRPSQS